MAGFVSRLVACLVAVVAVLQLVHLVLLNKLESTRLHELRHLQQQQQYHHQQQPGDQNLFQETFPLMSDNINQSPHKSGKNVHGYNSHDNNGYQEGQHQPWSKWRPERSPVSNGAAAAISPDVPEQEVRFDHLLREDQGAVVDSTGEYRIVFDVAGPRAGSQYGNLQQIAPAVIDKDAVIAGTNAQTDDFSIDDENFDGLAPPVDVTLVTFGNYQESIRYLIPLISRWNGPLSIAIFASNVMEMQSVLEFVSQARLCHAQTKQYVSFHLVFPLVETHSRRGAHNSHNSSGASSRFEKWKSRQDANLQQQHKKRLNPNSSITSNSINNSKLPMEMLIGKSCQSFRDQINKYYQNGGENGRKESKKYSSNDKNPVPSNLLRNVARRRVATEYSFTTHIAMIPSRDLRTSFQQFARDRMAAGSSDDKKTVFVVPAFEIKAEEQVPLVKSQLLSLVDKHKARPFQFDLCWKCQMYTDYETWQKDRNLKNGKFGILFEVLWKDPWEPFFISDNGVPLFDERFRSNGVSRTSQLCELHVAGYKFAVLNNAFVVHRGYTTASVRNQEEKTRDVDTSRAHFRQFKIELKDKYPHSTRRCY